MLDSSQKKILFAYITVTLASGTAYVGIHVAVESLHPLQLSALRFTLAGAILLLILRGFGLTFPSRHDWLPLTLVGFLMLTCAGTLIGWSSQYVTSVLISLLSNLSPLVYVGMARLTGERVPPRAWLGLCCGILGVIFLLSPRLNELWHQQHIHDAHYWPAVGSILLTPFILSFGTLLASRLPTHCHPLMAAAGQSLTGGVAAFTIALLIGEFHHFPRATLRSWLGMGWLIVVGSWMGYVPYIYCVSKLSAPRIGVITYLITINAVVAGWLVLGEKITPAMMLGGLVMLVGVALVQTAKNPVLPVVERESA
jgi:drug/metabolite transporter (DMT)-like permease